MLWVSGNHCLLFRIGIVNLFGINKIQICESITWGESQSTKSGLRFINNQETARSQEHCAAKTNPWVRHTKGKKQWEHNKKQVANNSFKVLEPDYARLFDWGDAAVKTNFLNNDILQLFICIIIYLFNIL